MTTKAKRNLFKELKQGIEEINAYRAGKMSLRTHKVEKKPRLTVDSGVIREIREELHMSRGVFALKLRISPRTLEKWEQGTAVSNEQAAVLLLMVRKYPDTLQRLEKI
jgi:putative transcriptional regulator